MQPLLMTMLIAIFFVSADSRSLPRFEDYPATSVFSRPSATPVLTTKHQKLFQTMIRRAARKGPNFAGHYTIASWGCGSDCHDYAIVDDVTGYVWDFSFDYVARFAFPTSNHLVPFHFGQGISFRKNSRLLIVDGCPNGNACAIYFYEWHENELTLLERLRKVPANWPDCSSRKTPECSHWK